MTTAAIDRTDLSDLARAVLARPIALLIIDAHTGSAEQLRNTAARYTAVADEVEPSGRHVEMVAILRVYASAARRHALSIDHGTRRKKPSPFLKLTTTAA
jgi:hypothetical protein